MDDGECGCMEEEIPECEYDEDIGRCTDGPCSDFEDCILVGEDECECQPECVYDASSDECFGECPFDAGDGVSCVRTDSDMCECTTCEDAYPEETASGRLVCNAECPEGEGQGCVPTSLSTCGCGCTWDEDEDECIGSCPFNADDGVSCVRTGPAMCECTTCEDAYPEETASGRLVCNAFCPAGDGDTVGCVPISETSCGCDPDCDEIFPDPNDPNRIPCNGICPDDGGSGPGCEPTNSNTACSCPICELEIVKTCKVAPSSPPSSSSSSSDGGKCKDLSELTLVWRGSSTVQVSAETDDLTLQTESGDSFVAPGQIITLGPFDGNDQVINVNSVRATIS